MLSYEKAARKMLLKWILLVNFTNILLAAFCQFPFFQKIINTKCKHRKGSVKRFFLQESYSLNVVEIILNFSQLYQHFRNSFCADILLRKISKPKCKLRKAAQNLFE
jgi:hypothetical protein